MEGVKGSNLRKSGVCSSLKEFCLETGRHMKAKELPVTVKLPSPGAAAGDSMARAGRQGGPSSRISSKMDPWSKPASLL